jgi:hypothetical protein
MTTTPLRIIYDGTKCLGFILSRGKLGHEAFDLEVRSLGVFETAAAASARVIETQRL